jgi:anti-sigma factor RsiW
MTAPRRASARCRALLLELSRFLDADLTPARRRSMERHLQGCAGCGQMAACLRKTIAACRAEGRLRLPADVRSRAAGRIRRLLASDAAKGSAGRRHRRGTS